MLDVFLEIAGVQGESKDASFGKRGVKPMEILKFSLGGTYVGEVANKREREKAQKKGEVSGRGTTLDKFSFSVSKFADTATIDLLQNFSQTLSKTIKPFASARVSIRKPGAVGDFFYMMLDFKEVFVVAYEMSFDDPEANTPTEDVDFCFSSCVMTYQPQLSDGTPGPAVAPMGWNFKTNKRIPS